MTEGFRAIRRKFWRYVAGVVATVAVASIISWQVANVALTLALSLVTFFIGHQLGSWYLSELREARRNGDAW